MCEEQSVSHLMSLPLQSWVPLGGRLQAEGLGVLCSCRFFPAQLSPGTGAGSGLCCHPALGVVILHPGQACAQGFTSVGNSLAST